jgi:hypothetical protein
MTPVTKRQAQ